MVLLQTLAVCLYTMLLVWCSYTKGYNDAIRTVDELLDDEEDE